MKYCYRKYYMKQPTESQQENKLSSCYLFLPSLQKTSANFLLVLTLYFLKELHGTHRHQASINHKSLKDKQFICHVAALHISKI